MWPIIIRGGVHNDNNNNNDGDDNKYLVGSCSPKREFELRRLGLGLGMGIHSFTNVCSSRLAMGYIYLRLCYVRKLGS